jgi:hypothetical protein
MLAYCSSDSYAWTIKASQLEVFEPTRITWFISQFLDSKIENKNNREEISIPLGNRYVVIRYPVESFFDLSYIPVPIEAIKV